MAYAALCGLLLPSRGRALWGDRGCRPLRSVGRRDFPCGLVSGRDGGVLVRVCAPGPAAVLLLLPLHAPVLKPDFDVALREAQRQRQFHAPWPRDVAVEEKLLLELQQLRARVRRPRALVLLGLRHYIWSYTKRRPLDSEYFTFFNRLLTKSNKTTLKVNKTSNLTCMGKTGILC